MSWRLILILVVVVVYVANVVGCLVLCETIPELEPARRYAWFVPILNILFPLFVLFDSAIKNKFELIWGFMSMPHKSITALSSVKYAMEEQMVKEKQYDPFHRKPSRQRQRAYVLAGSVARYGTTIFSEWLG